MYRLIVILFFLLSGVLQANQLPAGHFLFPRNWEPLWLLGIERGLGINASLRNLKNCSEPERLTNAYKRFHCQVFADSTLQSSVNLSYTNENFPALTIFGETHTNKDGQFFVAKVIKEAPSKFFNALALEMFNSSAQAEIDALTEKGATRAQWRMLLEKHWQYDLEGYLNIIEEALKKNMKILALDDRRKERDFDHNDNFSLDLMYRDRHMTENLTNYFIENPHHKVIFVTGKLHGMKSLSPERITIIEMLNDQLLGLTAPLQSRHYLLFDHKKTALFRSLKPDSTYPVRYQIKGQVGELADGVFLF